MRYYDPATGAYLTQDPVGAFVTGANRYGYAYADPVNLTDPTGEYVWLGVDFSEESLLRQTEDDLCRLIQEHGDDCAFEATNEICSELWRERGLGIGVGSSTPYGRIAPLLKVLERLLKSVGPKVRDKIRPLLEKFKLRAGERPIVRLEMEKQGKHIPTHKNYIEGRSPFIHKDPTKLLEKFAGKGQPVNQVPRGAPGFKERVDFREVIGQVNGQPTTKGIIHYSKNGAHIVPARP